MSKSIKLKNNVYWSSQIYDYTNKEVGVWYDGKKLYRKLIPITLPNGIQTTYPTGLSNVHVVGIEGYASYNNTTIPINYYNCIYLGSATHCYYDNGTLYLGCTFNGSNYNGHVILYFTYN